MKISLTTKRQNKCFHLRGVQFIRKGKRGIACLEGIRFHDVYDKTLFKDNAHVEIDIKPDKSVKAYYLCGIGKGSEYVENVGIAFVPCDGQSFKIVGKEFHLEVTDARNVYFQDDNMLSHVFARYISDGMPL